MKKTLHCRLTSFNQRMQTNLQIKFDDSKIELMIKIVREGVLQIISPGASDDSGRQYR